MLIIRIESKLDGLSHLTQVRGLKYKWLEDLESILQSHLTQVRGLKCFCSVPSPAWFVVAPHAGAWIEIPEYNSGLYPALVAPHAGAWIEITRGYCD